MRMPRWRRWTLLAAVASVATSSAGEPGGEPESAEHCHPAPVVTASPAAGPMSAAPARQRMAYAVPELRLTRADGKEVAIRRELEDARPVILNFIFTTCTTICPVMTQTLAKVQQRLGDARDRVKMISVSIDPEHDTPERLRAYAAKHGAGSQWAFYTGTTEASVALQKAFDAYRGNKMNHAPVTFVRPGPGQPWTRLEGLGNAEAILQEVQPALALSDRRGP